MKGRSIALDHINGREAAALLVDGVLSDVLIDTDYPRPGTIYRAIADRPVKGQGGMFLKTPDGNAFLRQVKGLSPGQALLVQVTGYAEPGKALPVTTKLLFKSRYAIVTPEAPGLNVSRSIRDEDLRDNLLEVAHEVMAGSDMGLILRTSSAEADLEELGEDIAAMRSTAEDLLAAARGDKPEKLLDGDGPHVMAWREWTDPAEVFNQSGSFEDLGVLDQIDALESPVVPLPKNASFAVEATRALIAVDVNTGGDTSFAAGLKANLATAKDLPRQLRLRGLGGQIAIDFAPMPKKDRRQVESQLRASLKACGVESSMVGWTTMGLFEVQRKRDRVPLTECLP